MKPLTPNDHDQAVRTLSQMVGMIDQIASLDSELDLIQIRRRLVELTLDLMAREPQPFDQAVH